jgi:hypothetical protein
LDSSKKIDKTATQKHNNMKTIYALLFSIAFGTTPIAAQQKSGSVDPMFPADLLCCAIPNTPATGFPAPSSFDYSSKVEDRSAVHQMPNINDEIQTSMITQDSMLQITDPYQDTDSTAPMTIDAFFLYPNPTSGIVQVKLSGKISVLIYTISGQLIKKYTLAHGERVLDLHDLPAGIYQVRARSDEDYFSGKLLIQ